MTQKPLGEEQSIGFAHLVERSLLKLQQNWQQMQRRIQQQEQEMNKTYSPSSKTNIQISKMMEQLRQLTEQLALQRKFQQNEFNQLKNKGKQYEVKCNDAKANLVNQEIKNLQGQLGQRDSIISQYQKQIMSLKEQKRILESYKATNMANQTVLKQKLERAEKNCKEANDNLTKAQDKHKKELYTFNKYQQTLKNSIDQCNEFSEALKNQDYQRQKGMQSKKQKGMFLKSGNFLTIMSKIKPLQNQFKSNEFKTELASFLKLINISTSEPEALLTLLQNKELERKFQTLVNLITKEYKKIQDDKVSTNQECQVLRRQLNQAGEQYAQLLSQIQGSGKQLDREKKANQTIYQESKNKEKASNEKIKKMDAETKRLEQEIQRFTRSESQLRKQKEELQETKKNQISNLKSTLEKEKLACQKNLDDKINLQKKIDLLQRQKSNLLAEKQQKIVDIQRHVKTIRTLQQQLQKDKTQIKSHQDQIKKLKKDLQNANSKILEHTRTIASMNKTIEELNSKIVKLQTIKTNLEKELKTAQERIGSLQSQIVKLKKQRNELQEKLSVANNKLQKMAQKLIDYQNQIRQLRIYKQACAAINKYLIPELSLYMGREVLTFNIEQSEHSCQQLLEWFKARYDQAKYFSDSEVIPKENVSFLLKQVKSLTNSSVVETRLLYKYDPRNNLNFHLFIDGMENLLVVIRLQTNYVVGGFSTSPLEKGGQMGLGKGIIFNLTNMKAFQMKKNAKTAVVTHDEFFFILGSSQLRLRAQNKEFYSNFGVAAGIFQTNGYPRTDFLGVNESKINQLDILGFEFYQIRLK